MVGGAGGEHGVTHLALAPSAGGDDTVAAVLAVLAGLQGGGWAGARLPAGAAPGGPGAACR
jgi:hypothetical protein